MSEHKNEKRILKLVVLLLIAGVILTLREIQLEALRRGINGTVLLSTATGLGACVTGAVVTIRGWKKRKK